MKLSNMSANIIISGIYKIIYPNKKIYIGQSQNIRARIMEHNQRARCISSDRAIQLCEIAMRKYNFQIEEFEVLEVVSDLSLLDEKEKYWIKYYDSTNKKIGYNLIDKGNVTGRRGVDNINASFTEKTINKIYDLLLNHRELSLKDIAKKYKVDVSTIIEINRGRRYINLKLTYPLRNNDHTNTQKNEVLDYFDTEQRLLELKEDLKKSWWLKIESDLVQKYKIPLRIMHEINNGHKFETIGNYSYPIRPKNQERLKFKLEDVLQILELLKTTNLTMVQIGEKFHCERNTISIINQGKRYKIPNFIYPARTVEKIQENMSFRKHFTKKVQCNTGEKFNSIKEAAQWVSRSESCIRACLNGKQKTSGLHPTKHIPLKWTLIEE